MSSYSNYLTSLSFFSIACLAYFLKNSLETAGSTLC